MTATALHNLHHATFSATLRQPLEPSSRVPPISLYHHHHHHYHHPTQSASRAEGADGGAKPISTKFEKERRDVLTEWLLINHMDPYPTVS